jgi:oligosaccharide reducing-end xylanase
MPKRLGISGFSLVVGLSSSLLLSCSSTTDSLGYTPTAVPNSLGVITCPKVPTNYFNTVLGLTPTIINNRLRQAIDTLYHGDTDNQRIYFDSEDFYTTVSNDIVCDFSRANEGTACIRDLFHNDIRTEGLGLGMLVSVMLNHREEFDRLWRYSTLKLRIPTGTREGFFNSFCDISDTEKEKCLDPYGLEQFVMALIVAHQRWGSTDSAHPNYEADALALFALMRHKVTDNGGIVDGVTDSFDGTAMLVYNVPDNGGLQFQRTALSNPGYFDIWAMAAQDSFFSNAALAARDFLSRAAHPITGLYPIAANFDGSPRQGYSKFAAAAFRVHLNLVIDTLWGNPSIEQKGYQTDIVNKMLSFFSKEGIDTYGSDYSIDGKTKNVPDHAVELVMANAVIAAISNSPDRKNYIDAAWKLPPPEGDARYYAGLMYLVGNLILAGQFKLCPEQSFYE